MSAQIYNDDLMNLYKRPTQLTAIFGRCGTYFSITFTLETQEDTGAPIFNT